MRFLTLFPLWLTLNADFLADDPKHASARLWREGTILPCKGGICRKTGPLFPLLIRSKIPTVFSERKVRLKLMALENLLFSSFGSIFLKD